MECMMKISFLLLISGFAQKLHWRILHLLGGGSPEIPLMRKTPFWRKFTDHCLCSSRGHWENKLWRAAWAPVELDFCFFYVCLVLKSGFLYGLLLWLTQAGERLQSTVAKVDKDSVRCQEDVALVAKTPLPVSSSGMRHHSDKLTVRKPWTPFLSLPVGLEW